MPTTEHLITSAFQRAWDIFKNDWVLFIVDGLLAAVVGAVTLGILMPAMYVGLIRVIKRRIHGEEASAGDVFSLGLPALLSSLVAGIIIGIAVGIGMVLLVIPGLLAALFLFYSFHFIAYDDASGVECLGDSFSLTKENLVPVLVLVLALAILNTLGGMVVFGTLVTFPFGVLVATIVFEQLRQTPEAA